MANACTVANVSIRENETEDNQPASCLNEKLTIFFENYMYLCRRCVYIRPGYATKPANWEALITSKSNYYELNG